MTIANWTTNASGDWNTASLWSGTVVPNASVDVTIDATTTLAFTVTIAAGETQTVHSLALNTVNNFGRANYPFSYTAAELELDGTLIFAAGSPGSLAGSNQSYIHVAAHKNAALLNAGTLSGFFEVEGNLLLTGTNSVYIRNEIQALAGTVTINAPIADIRGSTLIDGYFDAKGAGAIINLGGTTVGSANRIVNITTLAGPSYGWTELSLNGVTAAINEWNGSAYTPIETSLTTIGDGATLDVLGGRNYTTSNSLTIDATIGSSLLNSIFNLQAGTVTVGGGININKGIVQGYGTIANNVVNNSTMIALGGSVGGTLDLIGNLTGTGVITFDLNASTGTLDLTAATLELNAVSAGQTITLNTSNDVLILATPASFAGTIAAVTGGQIVLQGLTATTAVLANGTLVVKNGTQTVASLALAGSYTGDTITATGSVITIGAPISPSITGAVAVQAITDQGTITPFAGVVIADRNFRALETITVTLSTPANGTLTHLGGGQYDAVSGVYTTSGSSAAVTAALEGLVFVPTPRPGPPGSSVMTNFTITDVDTFAQQVSDSTTTVTTTVIAVAPTISGTVGGQVINGLGTIAPFAHVTILDANLGQTETVTVTQFSPSFGTLTPLPDIGTYDAATGVYTVSGSASFVTAAINALIFTPTAAPGQDVFINFSISDTDTASQTVEDHTTSVTANFPVAPPTISIPTANHAVTDQATIRPFAGALITDANIAQTETVTITLSSAANGTLVGGGSYVGGVYTITGDATVVSSILAGLVFTPTAHQVAPGATVPTQFVINDIDSASQRATAVTVTVIATAVAVAPTIQHTSTGLAISDRGTIAPFSQLLIGDVNVGQTETVTVTLSAAAHGSLINLGTGAYDPVAGVYTVSGDTVAVSAALNGLIFVPTQGEVAPGGTVVTTFTISTTDTALQSTTNDATTVIVTAGAVAPKITGPVPPQVTTDQAAIAPFAHVAVTDANFGQTETVTVAFFSGANGTLTALPNVGSFSDGIYTVVGTASEVTAALNGLVFTPTMHQVSPGGSTTTDFTIHDTDTASQSAMVYSTSVTATAVAVSPIINGGVAGQTVTDQTTIRPFGAVVITDANLGQTETVTVGLSVPANGTLSNLGAGRYDPATGIYTVVGAADAVTAALNGLVFIPTQHQVVPGATVATSFTITTTDTAGAIAADPTTSVIATAGTVIPTINGGLAGQTTSDQATIKPFGAVVIADANFGQTEAVTVSLSPANGTLSNPNAGNYNPATGVYTVSGTADAVTAALNGLVFTPTQHQVAPGATIATSFTITVTDTAGATVNNTMASVIATAGTVAPTINGGLAGQPTSDEATIRPFANVVIADANFDQTETVTVSLSDPANGTLSNPNVGNYNPATGVYTVIGHVGTVTAALNGLVFTPTQHQVAPGGTVTTAFTITDTDTAGATVSSATISVIATAGTITPTISGGLARQPTSDQATIRPFRAVVIADANFGQTETVTVSLPPANGTLSNPNAGSYNPATGVYTVSGTANAVTAALNGLIFIPTPHQIVPGGTIATTFTIQDTDTAGRTVTDTATSVITTAVATPPTINGAQAGQGITDQATIMPFRAIAIADANVGQTQTVTVTLSTPGNGTLSNPNAGSYNPGTGVYTVTGTVGVVNAALNGLVFTPTLHQIAPGGNVATGFAIRDTDTAGATALDTGTTVIVAAVAVVPTINGAQWGQTTTDNGMIAPFGAIVIDDANFGQTETVTVTLSSAANGTLSNLSGGNYNAAAGVYSFVGSASAATAALRGLVFTPTPHQVAAGGHVATSFTIRDTDSAAATATNTATSVIVTAAASMAFIVTDNITGARIDSAGVPYTGPQPGLALQYVSPTQNGVNINTSQPNSYIVTGSGNDAIDTSAGGGNNVINAYGGSNFISGGSGDNTIFLDNRVLTTDIWTTIKDYHPGDAVTLYGLTPSQKYSWWNDLGAAGYQGLTMLMQQPGQPNVALTLTGHTDADLTNGTLSLVYGGQGTDNPYLYVHGE